MKNFYPFFGMALAGFALSLPMQARQRPNIVLFLVDDMGWQETSVPFWEHPTPLNNRYHTPNMERLANMGVKFTQAYACAISSPSRCSLLSGMNAARHRVTNWTIHFNRTTDSPSDSIDLPEWNCNGIQPEKAQNYANFGRATFITPLPQLLHDHGYYTILCGKAHFGAQQTPGENPTEMGFDVNIAGAANGGPGSYLAADNYGRGDFHVGGLEKYYEKGTFLTEALTLEAIDHLKKPIAEKKPFFLYMSHYAIHIPYQPDIRFTSNYQDRDGQGVYDEQLKARLNKSEINHAALVEGMDKSLGDLMDFLEQHPKTAQNTIIIFMSDNGGQGVAVRQGREDFDQNWPARAGKGSAYLGGIKEPMIVYWPKVTKARTSNDNRIMIEDFFPSLLEMAGVRNYRTLQNVDGVSFVDLLKQPNKRRERTFIWHFPNIWTTGVSREEGYGAYSAIMKGDYHLVYFWETREKRLFNIKEDIGERNDVSAALPDLTQQLAQELSDSLRAYKAQRPTWKRNKQQVPWPDEP